MTTNQDTVKAYDATAAEYAAEAAITPLWVAQEMDAFVARLRGTGRVLEIGSGGGRDALEFEKRGIKLRPTDVSKGFVDLLRANGLEADLLDPLTDDLTDPHDPFTLYDGIWACASLIHVARQDFGTVVARLASATRQAGPLHLSVRDGDGEEMSTHGRADQPRHYVETYWREPALRSAVSDAGWRVSEIRHYTGRPGDHWLSVRAIRA